MDVLKVGLQACSHLGTMLCPLLGVHHSSLLMLLSIVIVPINNHIDSLLDGSFHHSLSAVRDHFCYVCCYFKVSSNYQLYICI